MRIGFDHPGYLWLLALLPVLWWIAYRRFSALGYLRAFVAILLRSTMVTAIVFAIAGIQIAWITDRVTVIYVLDQSESIDRSKREAMLKYVVDSVRKHRDKKREDLAGVIVFGKDASIEVPPFGDDLPPLSRLEGAEVRTDATNLEAALELAQSSMPSDTLQRIVIVTDGNQTIGQVQSIARRLAAAGIGIDVVPAPTQSGADVLVEKIDLPSEIRRGQPFEARVVMTNYADSDTDAPVRGRLSITRTMGGEEELLLDEPLELTPGKNVIPLRHTIDRPAPYTFEARFTPSGAEDDARSQNNRAVAFTDVRGKSRVLLIEPWNESGEWSWFADQLRDEEIEVIIQPSNATFTSLVELQAYDSVILANVPRNSGDSAESLTTISDSQIEMLVRNTQQLGAGLLMIGGPDSFGAGGWTGTALEEAMPVDFEIKNSVVSAVGALMLVVDSSGSMSGEKMELCKAAAREAIRSLRSSDYVGVITFDSEAREVVPMQKVAGRNHMIPMVSRISAGGGTNMYPAMERGFRTLVRADAAAKHMIVLTDGQTEPNNFAGLTQDLKAAGITVTSVAIGNDADLTLMREIATGGGGKMYHVISPRAIPKIVMRESRRISRPLIYEDPKGFDPRIEIPHVILTGVGTPPPIRGYVMTTAKDSVLVQTLLSSPVPQSDQHPILAAWQYGLGRTAVLTTDGGQRWARDWTNWPGQAKLYSQLVRWLMRPAGESGNFTMATMVRDGEVQVVINAMDQEQDFLNFLEMNASVLDPNMRPIDLQMRQTAPGRYVGSFPVNDSGSYFVHVSPGAGVAPLTSGVTVPFSEEYRAREMNMPLLEQIAAVQPLDGEAGTLTEPLSGDLDHGPLSVNPFRAGLRSVRAIQDVWPWLVLIGCCVFVSDVMVRRIDFNFRWVGALVKRLRGEPVAEPVVVSRLDSLRQSKQQATKQLGRYQQATLDTAVVQDPAAMADKDISRMFAEAEKSSPLQSSMNEPTSISQSMSYTERLLEAKRKSKR